MLGGLLDEEGKQLAAYTCPFRAPSRQCFTLAKSSSQRGFFVQGSGLAYKDVVSNKKEPPLKDLAHFFSTPTRILNKTSIGSRVWQRRALDLKTCKNEPYGVEDTIPLTWGSLSIEDVYWSMALLMQSVPEELFYARFTLMHFDLPRKAGEAIWAGVRPLSSPFLGLLRRPKGGLFGSIA